MSNVLKSGLLLAYENSTPDICLNNTLSNSQVKIEFE
jgi:hypothetical protein